MYDGNYHNVVTYSGSVVGGTLEVMCNDCNEEKVKTWHDANSSGRKDIQTTTWKVRVKGDANHNDVDCGTVTVFIYEYELKGDSNSHSISAGKKDTYTITSNKSVSDKTFVWSVKNENGTFVTNSGGYFTADFNKNGKTTKVTINSTSKTPPGTYRFYFVIGQYSPYKEFSNTISYSLKVS